MTEENEWHGIVVADVVQGPIDEVTEDEASSSIRAVKLGKSAGVLEDVTENVVSRGMIGTLTENTIAFFIVQYSTVHCVEGNLQFVEIILNKLVSIMWF